MGPAGTNGGLVLVVGGSASGKSRRALELAGAEAPRAFLATGQPLDEEMTVRIRRHQAERSDEWKTIEIPIEVTPWMERNGPHYRAIVLDCLTLWLNNLCEHGVEDEDIHDRVMGLLTAIKSIKRRVVVVTNELGMGLVPSDPDSRRFRDLAGIVNQMAAREADEVYAVLSGLLMRLK